MGNTVTVKVPGISSIEEYRELVSTPEGAAYIELLVTGDSTALKRVKQKSLPTVSMARVYACFFVFCCGFPCMRLVRFPDMVMRKSMAVARMCASFDAHVLVLSPSADGLAVCTDESGIEYPVTEGIEMHYAFRKNAEMVASDCVDEWFETWEKAAFAVSQELDKLDIREKVVPEPAIFWPERKYEVADLATSLPLDEFGNRKPKGLLRQPKHKSLGHDGWEPKLATPRSIAYLRTLVKLDETVESQELEGGGLEIIVSFPVSEEREKFWINEGWSRSGGTIPQIKRSGRMTKYKRTRVIWVEGKS